MKRQRLVYNKASLSEPSKKIVHWMAKLCQRIEASRCEGYCKQGDVRTHWLRTSHHSQTWHGAPNKEQFSPVTWGCWVCGLPKVSKDFFVRQFGCFLKGLHLTTQFLQLCQISPHCNLHRGFVTLHPLHPLAYAPARDNTGMQYNIHIYHSG